MFVDTTDSVIVQNSKQYKPLSEFVAAYDELPYEIARGASVTGVVAFPAIGTSDIEFTLDIHSDDFDEELGEMVVRIGKENSKIITSWPKEPEPVKPSKPTYASIVGTYQGTEVNMGSVTATFYSDGTLSVITSSASFTGTWTQTNGQAHFTLIEPNGFEWTPQDVTVTSSGIDGLWGEFFQRVG